MLLWLWTEPFLMIWSCFFTVDLTCLWCLLLCCLFPTRVEEYPWTSSVVVLNLAMTSRGNAKVVLQQPRIVHGLAHRLVPLIPMISLTLPRAVVDQMTASATL
jgi:hypothetical protein